MSLKQHPDQGARDAYSSLVWTHFQVCLLLTNFNLAGVRAAVSAASSRGCEFSGTTASFLYENFDLFDFEAGEVEFQIVFFHVTFPFVWDSIRLHARE